MSFSYSISGELKVINTPEINELVNELIELVPSASLDICLEDHATIELCYGDICGTGLIADIENVIARLGEYAIEGTKFEIYLDNDKSVMYVGSAEQRREAESKDAYNTIESLLPLMLSEHVKKVKQLIEENNA